jgi:hypothetical protein
MRKTFAFVTGILIVIACGGSNGGSVLCGANGATQCGGGQPFCDSALGCVACRSDSDCGATSPRCIEGSCRACATNSDCGATAPSCWADHQCHAACTPTSCPNDISICDTASGDCIGCKQNQDCVGGQNGAICDTALLQCVECETNGDCPATAPHCFLGDHSCVQCFSNSDCPSAQPICDRQDLRCRSGCTSNSDCSNNQTAKICDTANTTCVQCLQKSDCPETAPLCDTQRNICGICLVDADCAATPATPHCNRKGDVYSCIQ